jgi:hypothetical protein
MSDRFIVVIAQTGNVLIDLNHVHADGGLEARQALDVAAQSDPGTLRFYCWFGDQLVRPATMSVPLRMIRECVEAYAHPRQPVSPPVEPRGSQPGLFDLDAMGRS